MTPERRKVVLLAVVPAILAPFGAILSRTQETPIFLGLSGQFWAGAIIGISLVALAVAAFKYARLPSQT